MNEIAVTTHRPRRRWPLALGIVLALLVFLVLASAAAVSWLGEWGAYGPVHVVIDGDESWTFEPAMLAALHPAALVGGLLIAALAVVVVVPLALGLAFVGIAFGLAVGLGVPLLVVLLVAALLLSPLLLLVWLGVWLARRASAPQPVSAANIAP